MPERFSFAPQCSKKINRKIFLGQKHDLWNFEASLNIVQEAFGDLLLEKIGKRYREIETILAAQGVQLPRVQKDRQINSCKNLLRVGRP